MTRAKIASEAVSRSLLHSRQWVMAWLAGSILLVAVGFLSDGYAQSMIREALVLGLFAMSLDFLWSRTGILSFGHAAFFGIGGYTMSVLEVRFHWTALQALPAAIGAAVLAATVFGYFLFYGKVRGTYFTLMTMALTLVCQQTAISWASVTGGDSGLINVPGLRFDGGFDLSGDEYSYFFVAAATIAISWILRKISCSRYGLILQIIQDHETRAAALGYDTNLYLLSAFVCSAFVAGLAGVLYVSTTGIVAPDLIGLQFSTEVIVWVAVVALRSWPVITTTLWFMS